MALSSLFKKSGCIDLNRKNWYESVALRAISILSTVKASRSKGREQLTAYITMTLESQPEITAPAITAN